jgi:hypothetical protein
MRDLAIHAAIAASFNPTFYSLTEFPIKRDVWSTSVTFVGLRYSRPIKPTPLRAPEIGAGLFRR